LAKQSIKSSGLSVPIMIDCSHGNSNKDHRNQPKVALNIAEQVRSGEDLLVGIMLESNLNEGKQSVPDDGPVALEYGVSITDGCINWKETENVLDILAKAVQDRRLATDLDDYSML
jgi:3-deoxy-7-phosphoheptulonate synthase